MREETGLMVLLLRRPPRTPAAFNGRIRDKRERKQEIHPSANEIFAVHSRGKRKWRTERGNKDASPLSSLHYQDYTGSSVRSTVEADAKGTVTHSSKFIPEEETLGFEVKHKAAFFYVLTTFTQEWLRTELVVHLNANEVRPMRSECSEVWSLSPGSSAFHSGGCSRSRLSLLESHHHVFTKEINNQ